MDSECPYKIERPEEVDLPYLWLSDDEYAHLMFSTRAQVGAILNCLRGYGQSIIVDGAIQELMLLFDLFGQRIRGKDIPVTVLDEPKPISV